MATQGTAVLDFGVADTYATVAVTGQAGITTGNLVEAWINPSATANNTADDHLTSEIIVQAGNIVNGTGFTIYGHTLRGLAHGQFNINWVWN